MWNAPRWSGQGWPTWFGRSLAVIAASYVVLAVRDVAVSCYFIGDDFSTLWRLHTLPLRKVLFEPLGGQIVPLHRLTTWFVDRVAPMRFGAALGTLVLFHLLSMALLYGILQGIRRTRLNLVVLAAYATHVLFGFELTWFSSGLTRFPYITGSLAAIAAYLAHSRTGDRRFLVGATAAHLFALGFYTKGLLIPFCCVAADLARAPWPDESARVSDRFRGKLPWLVASAVVTVAYLAAARRAMGADAALNPNLGFQLGFQKLAWSVFLNGLCDRILTFEAPGGSVLVILACIALVAGSVFVARSSARAWGLGALLVTANFLFIGLSSRTLDFGALMALELRHYYELAFVAALFGGMALHHVLGRWRPEARPRAALAAAAAFAALFAVHVARSYAESRRLVAAMSPDMIRVRAFVEELRGSLGSVTETTRGQMVLLDAPFPRYITYLDLQMRLYSELFAALGIDAKFGDAARATHSVTDEGRIFVRPSTKASARPADSVDDVEANNRILCEGTRQVLASPERLAPAELERLRGCDAEAAYYGIARGADFDEARTCALAQLAEGSPPVFGGPAILMMIHANGRGVARDVSLAMKYACEVGGAPAELMFRLQRLARMRDDPKAGPLDLCDDVTSGFMSGHCAAHAERLAAVKRLERKRKVAANLPEAELEALDRAAKAFFDAREQNEVDLSGTMRAALQVAERARLEDFYVAVLEQLRSRALPAVGSGNVNAESELDQMLSRLMTCPDLIRMEVATGVTRRGLRETQERWLAYRDAWLALATKVRPETRRKDWARWLATERTDALFSLGQGCPPASKP